MPRLVYAVPCLSPIVSQEGLLTLVNVIERITVDSPSESIRTLDSPITVIVYLWRMAGDEGKDFELRMRIELPNGRTGRQKVLAPFKMADVGHRYLISLRDFPVTQAGTYWIHIDIREAGAEARFKKEASYPLEIVHIHPPSDRVD